MPIESFAKQNCSIARTLSILGERWTLIVLTELFVGRTRFEEIQEERGIATNILSQRLATLVDHGIAEQRRYSSRWSRGATSTWPMTDRLSRASTPSAATPSKWSPRALTAGRRSSAGAP